jgi:mRNA interferase RelE/StbE
MAWRIEVERAAAKELEKLDRQDSRRILRFLSERVAKLSDPRGIGEALKGPELGSFWKYRVGDFRIIVAIEDARLLVLVVRIGNRREVYKR